MGVKEKIVDAFRVPGLPADTWTDPVVEAYKRDVDRTLLRENLKLTPEERLLKLQGSCGS